MKQFLRLVFLGSVLFVLLGLYSQNRDHSDSARADLDGIEQIASPSGILSHQQEIPSLVSLNFESPTPKQALSKIRKFQEEHFSIRSKSQLELAECLYEDIKYDLFCREGLYLYYSTRQHIQS